MRIPGRWMQRGDARSMSGRSAETSADGRWGARLKRSVKVECGRRSDKFDKPCRRYGDRRRKLRHLGQDRARDQRDGRADRTGIGGAAVMVGRNGRLVAARGLQLRDAGRAMGRDLVEMDVAERQNDLDSEREQREPRSKPSMRSNPPHPSSAHAHLLPGPIPASRPL